MDVDIKNLTKAIAHRLKTKPIEIPDSVPEDQMEGYLKGFGDGIKWTTNIVHEEIMRIMENEVKIGGDTDGSNT